MHWLFGNGFFTSHQVHLALVTGGITAVCLLGTFAGAGAGGYRRALLRLTGAFAVGLVAFVLADPYAVLDWHGFTGGVSSQAALAGGQDPTKIGTGPGSGVAYYVWSFTWGLGWAPSLAALGPDWLVLKASRPGSVYLHVHFSPYWELTEGSGCVEPAGDFTRLTLRRAGTVKLQTVFSFTRIAASSPRCT